ncbi:Protein of unknown function [Gryllus bimaculatus]|nr:Protein of unknown function [Gryllus bimaculatus]
MTAARVPPFVNGQPRLLPIPEKSFFLEHLSLPGPCLISLVRAAQGERGTVPAAAAGETDNGASAGGCIIIQPGGDDETTADAAAINTAAIQLMQTDEQCGGEGSSARKRGNGADTQSGNSTGPPTRMGSGVPSGASQPKGQGKQSNTSKGRHGRHKSTTASAQQNGRGGLQGKKTTKNANIIVESPGIMFPGIPDWSQVENPVHPTTPPSLCHCQEASLSGQQG